MRPELPCFHSEAYAFTVIAKPAPVAVTPKPHVHCHPETTPYISSQNHTFTVIPNSELSGGGSVFGCDAKADSSRPNQALRNDSVREGSASLPRRIAHFTRSPDSAPASAAVAVAGVRWPDHPIPSDCHPELRPWRRRDLLSIGTPRKKADSSRQNQALRNDSVTEKTAPTSPDHPILLTPMTVSLRTLTCVQTHPTRSVHRNLG